MLTDADVLTELEFIADGVSINTPNKDFILILGDCDSEGFGDALTTLDSENNVVTETEEVEELEGWALVDTLGLPEFDS